MKKALLICLTFGMILLVSCTKPDVFEPVISDAPSTSYSQSTTIGETGTSDGQFTTPTMIQTDGDYLYICDHPNSRIVKFTKSGNFVKNISWIFTKGTIDAHGFGFNNEGNIMLLDYPAYHLYELSKAGGLIEDHGVIAPNTGKFAVTYPVIDFVVSKAGYMFVLDIDGNIDKFNPEGNYIKSFGGTGTGNGKFQTPQRMAIGPDNLLYVVDSTRLDVQVFTLQGNFIRKWGDGTVFGHPTIITIDKIGYVYVADSMHDKVFKFKPTGELVTSWDIPAGTPRGISPYQGITVDDAFNVYVTDVLQGLVHVFANN